MLKCLIIDDEELARKLLEGYIELVDFLTLEGSFENPIQTLSLLKETTIDLIFLDIQMPEIKGIDFIKFIPKNTNVIFTTAYSEYAVEGFNLGVVDYLLKPITFERFLLSVNKIKEYKYSLKSDAHLIVKSGYEIHKIKIEDINFIKSESEYVIYHTNDKKVMSYQSLKALESELNNSIFQRVHRSYIVNKNKITGLKGKELILSSLKIPISDSYFEKVKKDFFNS